MDSYLQKAILDAHATLLNIQHQGTSPMLDEVSDSAFQLYQAGMKVGIPSGLFAYCE